MICKYVVILSALLLVMCSSKPSRNGYNNSVPAELQKEIETHAAGGLYAVGTAYGSEEMLVINKATMQARAELARQFKSQVYTLQKSYEESVNDRMSAEFSQVMQLFGTLELRGSRIIRTLTRREKRDGWSAKVLVAVSSEDLKALFDDQMHEFTSFKASKAHKELEERVIREAERNRNTIRGQ